MKTLEETNQLKNAKYSYQQRMKLFLGTNWKKLSEKLKCYNVPDDPKVRQEILSNI